MTTYNKQTLATFFQTNDIPDGTDFANLIDSQVNIVETSVQNMAGALGTTELIASRVSAGNVNVTGTLNVAGITSANTIYANNIIAGSASYTNQTVTNLITTTVSATNLYSTNGLISGVGVVSAAGTTQGTAASLVNVINRGKGIADGTTTGFTPLTNKPGLVQYLFNEGASANLWPPTGGFINGLAANAVFPLAASAMVTIVHLTASAYAVK